MHCVGALRRIKTHEEDQAREGNKSLTAKSKAKWKCSAQPKSGTGRSEKLERGQDTGTGRARELLRTDWRGLASVALTLHCHTEGHDEGTELGLSNSTKWE